MIAIPQPQRVPNHISGGVFHGDVPIRHPDCAARSRLHVAWRSEGTRVPIRAEMGKASRDGTVEKGGGTNVLLARDQVG